MLVYCDVSCDPPPTLPMYLHETTGGGIRVTEYAMSVRPYITCHYISKGASSL